jgi:quinolinate synthase
LKKDFKLLRDKILELKSRLGVTIASHFYQRDEVFNIADITGDSFELAKKASSDKNRFLIFCGVGFMGQSVKILSPETRVLMPRIACCSMAKMIDRDYFIQSVERMQKAGIDKKDILPITYINSNAEVKAEVGKMGGVVCTSSNAKNIMTKALQEKKKILFVPDKCLGQNLANMMGLKSAVLGIDENLKESDVICYDGFCSVHQLFTVEDIEFYRAKYPNILIAVHPECTVEVVAKADFVGSTSQIMAYVKSLDVEQKVAIGTEFNLVNRLRDKNTYVLSSTKPECPTMNETTLEDVLNVLKSIEAGSPINEMIIDEETAKWAKIALNRMLELC